MIIGKIEASKRYFSVHPLMQALFDYVQTHALDKLPTGKIELIPGELYINVDEVQLKQKENQRLEAHRKFIDIQMPLGMVETMGWSPLASLGAPDAPFDIDRDVVLYSQPAESYFDVHLGEFVVFFPEDGHAPIIGEGKQRKIIGKLKI
ncbi:MAG: YhcH/YjgK/YiaL family protein [Prevotella sp.]